MSCQCARDTAASASLGRSRHRCGLHNRIIRNADLRPDSIQQSVFALHGISNNAPLYGGSFSGAKTRNEDRTGFTTRVHLWGPFLWYSTKHFYLCVAEAYMRLMVLGAVCSMLPPLLSVFPRTYACELARKTPVLTHASRPIVIERHRASRGSS